MVSFAVILPAWCLPSTHSGTTNSRAISQRVACGPAASESPEVLIKLEDPAFPWGGSETSVFSWPSRGLMPPKFGKPGLKGLELPTTPIPKDPCLGQGCTGPLGGWCQLVSPRMGTLAPTALGRQAWVSTGASRLACAQPSPGRPWSPWALPCVLLGVGAVVGSARRRRRPCRNHCLQPIPGTAASAWCRSIGCQGWWPHRVVRLGQAVCWAVEKGVARVLWVATFWFCYPERQKKVLSGISGNLSSFPPPRSLPCFHLGDRVRASPSPTAWDSTVQENWQWQECCLHCSVQQPRASYG